MPKQKENILVADLARVIGFAALGVIIYGIIKALLM